MARSRRERRSLTDWLARHLLGPAQVSDVAARGRQASADERARESALRTELVRVQDASGRTYLVARSSGTPDERGDPDGTPDSPPTA